MRFDLASDLGRHIVVAANVVAVVAAHGFLHACAALRDLRAYASYRGVMDGLLKEA
ncbi:hypothetical protein D3C81_680070 [compost metagenome]|jgi:hypothetical protein